METHAATQTLITVIIMVNALQLNSMVLTIISRVFKTMFLISGNVRVIIVRVRVAYSKSLMVAAEERVVTMRITAAMKDFARRAQLRAQM
jgi:hypothetical protein